MAKETFGDKKNLFYSSTDLEITLSLANVKHNILGEEREG